jgi:hypothetical protein
MEGCAGGQGVRDWREWEWHLFSGCRGLHNIFRRLRHRSLVRWGMLKDSFIGWVLRGFVDRGSDDLVTEARSSLTDALQECCVIEGGGELVGGLV